VLEQGSGVVSIERNSSLWPLPTEGTP